ncbi:hypothetical protein ACJX0J_006695 [Zea mays]
MFYIFLGTICEPHFKCFDITYELIDQIISIWDCEMNIISFEMPFSHQILPLVNYNLITFVRRATGRIIIISFHYVKNIIILPIKKKKKNILVRHIRDINVFMYYIIISEILH